MRKQLLACLAVLGLAGLSSPAQVEKGSQPVDTQSADTTKNGKTSIQTDAFTVKQKTQLRRKTTHKKTATDNWQTGSTGGSKNNHGKTATDGWQSGSTGSSKTGRKNTAPDDWETGSSGTGHKKGSDNWMQADSRKKKTSKTATATKTVQPDAGERPVKPPQ